MNEQGCATVRELIPGWVGHRLDRGEAELVERHLERCGDCSAEAELAALLYASRPAVPAELSARVTRAVRRSRGEVRRPWWAASAAAVAALALGIGIASEPSSPVDLDVPPYAYEYSYEAGDDEEVWLSGDGVLAGSPMLDALSDEALEALLDELILGTSGGAA